MGRRLPELEEREDLKRGRMQGFNENRGEKGKGQRSLERLRLYGTAGGKKDAGEMPPLNWTGEKTRSRDYFLISKRYLKGEGPQTNNISGRYIFVAVCMRELVSKGEVKSIKKEDIS